MNTLRKAAGEQLVAEMEARFERVRRAQIDFQPVRTSRREPRWTRLGQPHIAFGSDLLSATMPAMNKLAPFLWFNDNAEEAAAREN